jgi:hypothetical protein
MKEEGNENGGLQKVVFVGDVLGGVGGTGNVNHCNRERFLVWKFRVGDPRIYGRFRFLDGVENAKRESNDT